MGHANLDEELFYCRICGLRYDDPPWGEDNHSPLFEFCLCCGVMFGYQDSTPQSCKKYRAQWLEKGAKWDMPKARPEDWDLSNQLQQIPSRYL